MPLFRRGGGAGGASTEEINAAIRAERDRQAAILAERLAAEAEARRVSLERERQTTEAALEEEARKRRAALEAERQASVTALEAERVSQQRAVNTLQEQITRLAEDPATAELAEYLQAQLNQLQDRVNNAGSGEAVADLQTRLAQLSERVEGLQSGDPEARAQIRADVDALTSSVSTLDGRVTALGTDLGGRPTYDDLTALTQAVQTRAAQTDLATLVGRVDDLAARPIGTAEWFPEVLIDDLLSTGTNILPPGLRVPKDTTLRAVHLAVAVVPVGAAITLQVLRGTTVLATVSIPAGAATASLALTTPVALTAGQRLTFNLTSVGTTEPGQDLAAALVCS